MDSADHTLELLRAIRADIARVERKVDEANATGRRTGSIASSGAWSCAMPRIEPDAWRRLRRTVQCTGCPWRVAADPNAIPNGYSVERHRALSRTIARPADPASLGADTLHVMACHEHDAEEGVACVGWLHHQLGAGNNLALRVQLMRCENVGELRLRGEQHRSFEDTLPGGS